jgi:outer membrane protein assembly factor BamB
VLYQQAIYFGSGDSNIYAIHKTDGKLIWRYKTSGVVHATPAIGDNKLFVGSFDGYFYALNISDGSLIWKFKAVGERYFPKGEFQGSPVAANGLVFVGSRDFNLYALDMNKGYCHWNTSFTGGWAMALTLSANDSILYEGTSDDRVLIAADVFTGKEIWRTDVHFNIFGPCVLSSLMCYVGTLLGKLYGLDLKTGIIEWTFTDEGYHKNHLHYFKEDDSYRDDIYSLIQSDDDYIKWMCDIGAIFSAPVISGDQIIISSTDGNIYSLKRNS